MSGALNGSSSPNGIAIPITKRMRKRSEVLRNRKASEAPISRAQLAPLPEPPKRRSNREFDIEVPNNPVTQQLIIAAAFADANERSKLVREFTCEWFSADEHKEVWRALTELERKGLAFDPDTLVRLNPDADIRIIETLLAARPEVPPNHDQNVEWFRQDRKKRNWMLGPFSAVVDAVQDPTTTLDRISALMRQAGESIAGSESTSSSPFVFRTAMTIAKPRPPVPLIMPHFGIRRGRVTVIHAYAGIGKTILLQDFLLSIAAGLKTCWGGLDLCVQGPAVHIDYEMGPDDLDDRYRRLANARKVKLASLGDSLRLCSMPKLYLSSDPIEVEEAFVKATTGVVVAGIDNLGAATPHAPRGANDAGIRVYLDLLTRVSLRTGCAFTVLAHDGKSNKETAGRASLQKMRGSSAIADASGSALGVSVRDGILKIEHTKSSHGSTRTPIRLRFVDVGDEYLDEQSGELLKPGLAIAQVSGEDDSEGPSDRAVAKAKDVLLTIIRKAKPRIGVNEALRLAKGNRSITRDALNELRERGTVITIEGPGKTKLLRLADNVTSDDLDDESDSSDDESEESNG